VPMDGDGAAGTLPESHSVQRAARPMTQFRW
jgi:hypothetical protein